MFFTYKLCVFLCTMILRTNCKIMENKKEMNLKYNVRGGTVKRVFWFHGRIYLVIRYYTPLLILRGKYHIMLLQQYNRALVVGHKTESCIMPCNKTYLYEPYNVQFCWCYCFCSVELHFILGQWGHWRINKDRKPGNTFMLHIMTFYNLLCFFL